MRQSRAFTGVLVSLGLLVAACGGDNDASPSTTAAAPTSTAAGTASTSGSATSAASTPTPGGKIVVRIESEVGNPWVPANTNCDTGCQTRWRTWFEPLVAVDSRDATVKPYLAESITPSADYKTWTVKVRPGVNFSDGTMLDADVVVDNLQRARKSALVGPALVNIVDVQKVDAMTVDIVAATPWVDLPAYLIGPVASSKWLAQTDTDPGAALEPIGTGPFLLDSFKAGESTVVKKNPGYWRKAEGLPYLDEIEFRVVPDELTAGNALRAGELDVLVTANGQNLKALKADSSYDYFAHDRYGQTHYLMLNLATEGSPLLDRNVRCGLTAATDTNTLTEVLSASQYPVANGPFSPGQQGHLEDNGNQKFDPAKAKELIKTWSDANGGQKPKIVVSTVTDATAQQEAQLLQQWWTDAGAEVEVVALEQSKLITNALLGDPGFMAFGWLNHNGNLFEYQTAWWSSATAVPPGLPALNFARLKDARLDGYLKTARENPDPAAQLQAAEAANRLFAEECWIVPVTWPVWGVFSTHDVQGLGEATFPDGVTPRADGEQFPGTMQWSAVHRVS